MGESREENRGSDLDKVLRKQITERMKEIGIAKQEIKDNEQWRVFLSSDVWDYINSEEPIPNVDIVEKFFRDCWLQLGYNGSFNDSDALENFQKKMLLRITAPVFGVEDGAYYEIHSLRTGGKATLTLKNVIVDFDNGIMCFEYEKDINLWNK